MSLVQYSSSDESSDDEQELRQTTTISSNEARPENVIDRKPAGPGTSLSSLLPPPKNRQQPKREPRVLGKAIKSIAGESQVNPDNIVLERSSKQTTSFIPSSLRNKKVQAKGNTLTQQKEKKTQELPKVELFQPIKTRPRSTVPSSSVKLEVQPIINGPEIIQEPSTSAQQQNDHPTKKRQRGEEIVDANSIKEFNVDQFYQQNLELKNEGLLQENKKLHSITHSKNQLSALVKNAKQDGDLLDERIEHNKRLKKERGDKYGW